MIFSHFLAKFGQKHHYVNQLPWKPDKTEVINFTGFLPLIDSLNSLPKFNFVESAIFEIMEVSLTPSASYKVWVPNNFVQEGLNI